MEDPIEDGLRPLGLGVRVGEAPVRQSLNHAAAKSSGHDDSDDRPHQDPASPPDGKTTQPFEHRTLLASQPDLGAITYRS